MFCGIGVSRGWLNEWMEGTHRRRSVCVYVCVMKRKTNPHSTLQLCRCNRDINISTTKQIERRESEREREREMAMMCYT